MKRWCLKNHKVTCHASASKASSRNLIIEMAVISQKKAAAGTGGKIKWTVLLTKFLEIAGH